MHHSVRLFVSLSMNSCCGVVHILHNRLLSMSRSTVMGAQCEQEGSEHITLRGSSVDH